MNISIKEIYYDIEDKWFDLLDSIDQKIPVYKVIDPIEKAGVPSLPVFIALTLLILYFLLGGVILPQSQAFTLRVTDSSGNCYDTVMLEILKDNTLILTETFEGCDFQHSLKHGDYSLRVTPEDCNSVSRTLTISKGIDFIPMIIDCQGRPLAGSVDVCFEQNNLGTVFYSSYDSSGNIKDYSKECGIDSCTLPLVEGYSYIFETNEFRYTGIALTADELQDMQGLSCITLTKKIPPTPQGEVIINVIDALGNPVPNQKVELMQAETINVITSSLTNSKGQVLFKENIETKFRINIPTTGNTTRYRDGEYRVFKEETQTFDITLEFTIPTLIEVYDEVSELEVPISGVFVSAIDSQDEIQADGITADGEIEFGLEVEKKYKITLFKEKYEYKESEVIGGGKLKVKIEEISKAKTGTIETTVYYEEILIAVDGATLVLYEEKEGKWEKTGYGSATGWPLTNSQGKASFEFVKPGRYCVTASKESETICPNDDGIVDLKEQDVIPVTLYLTPERNKLFVKVIQKDGYSPAVGAKVTVHDSLLDPLRIKPLATGTTNAIGEINQGFSLEKGRTVFIYVEYTDPFGEQFLYKTSSIVIDKTRTEDIYLIPINGTNVRFTGITDKYGTPLDSIVIKGNEEYILKFSISTGRTTTDERWDSIKLTVSDKEAGTRNKIKFAAGNLNPFDLNSYSDIKYSGEKNF